MKFPIFSFPALKEKFSSHISSFCSKNRPAIKDFLHYAGVPLLFALSFLAGSAARVIVQHFSPPEAVATSSDCASWGLSFQEEGKRPVGNASIQELLPITPTLQRIPRRKYSTLLLTVAMKMAIHRCFLMH